MEDNLSQAHDLSPGLLRQRRNLMLTSGAMIFLGVAGAKLHSFQLLGLHITFERPEAVVEVLFVVTVYLIYRYSLYLRQEPGPGLSSEFYQRLNRYAKPKLLALRDEKYPQGKGLQLEEQLGVRPAGPFSWVIQVQVSDEKYNGFKTEDLVVSASQVWLSIAKASVMACLARSYLTDYVVPFLLGFGAIVVGVSKYQF